MARYVAMRLACQADGLAANLTHHELPLESWRVSLCGRLAWCHPRVMGWRLQCRFSLNLSSLCVTDLTAVAIHNESTTAVAVLSGDACSGKPPSPGIFAGQVYANLQVQA